MQHTRLAALSKHRHISFTAHYTGYVWYQMGISHPAFASMQGRFYTQLLHPLESFAERFVGTSIRQTLKIRHQLIDEQLQQLLDQQPQLQVLEIAAGLSPRGWRFKQHYPNLNYCELDLPAMAATKQRALAQISSHSHPVLALDLFSDAFAQAFEQFNPEQPLLIISEGLINYFDKASLLQLIQNIAKHAQSFQQLHYITDLYPEPTQHKLSKVIWHSSKLLKLMSRSAFSFHFTQPQQVQDFFAQAGFRQVSVIQPSAPETTLPTQHLGDMVWIISAQLAAQSTNNSSDKSSDS